MVEKELPKGWVGVQVNDIATDIKYGYTESASSDAVGPKFLRITDIQNNQVNWDNVPFCRIEEEQKVKYLLADGDLVFARTGATVGKSFLIKGNIPEAVYASYLIRLRFPKSISDKFVYNFFQSHDYWKQIAEGQVGIGQPNVNGKKLGEITLPLPPLPEQHRIVAKIEELFSELDNGVAQLQALLAQLKTYRQSVLKWAFEGRLTEGWRRQQLAPLGSAAELLEQIRTERQARYEADLTAWKAAKARGEQASKPSAPKDFPPLTAEELEGLPELPEGWMWVKLGNVIHSLDQGWSPKCENHPANLNDWAVIKTSAIQAGYFVQEENKKLPLKLKPRRQHELMDDDILVTRAGPRVRVGVCCLVKNVRDKLLNCDKAYRIKTSKNVLSPAYFVSVLNSPFFVGVIERLKTGINDSGLNLTQDNFQSMAIPFCSLEEQHQIVTAIETRLSACEEAEGAVRRALAQAEGLRQSILKRAFEGRLVPQGEG